MPAELEVNIGEIYTVIAIDRFPNPKNTLVVRISALHKIATYLKRAMENVIIDYDINNCSNLTCFIGSGLFIDDVNIVLDPSKDPDDFLRLGLDIVKPSDYVCTLIRNIIRDNKICLNNKDGIGKCISMLIEKLK